MEQHYYNVSNVFGYPEARRQAEFSSVGARSASLDHDVIIPVVVHIVYNSDSQNISDEQVVTQIDVLNKDYAGVNDDVGNVPNVFQPVAGKSKIRFQLAKRDALGRMTNGILRRRTRIQNFPEAQPPTRGLLTAYINRELKVAETGSVAWPRDQYLNLWVCDMNKDPLGYAAFPGSNAWEDGVVIDYKCFGVGGTAESPYDLGRTATHEVGHWLNLLHIWGDDDGHCTHSDNVGDTPNQGSENYGTPTFPNISCNNAPNGDMFMSYMDYVNDSAMCMFSKGQVERMHASLIGARASLLVSMGLQEPDAQRDALNSPQLLMREFASVGAANAAQMVFDGVSWVPASPGDE